MLLIGLNVFEDFYCTSPGRVWKAREVESAGLDLGFEQTNKRIAVLFPKTRFYKLK